MGFLLPTSFSLIYFLPFCYYVVYASFLFSVPLIFRIFQLHTFIIYLSVLGFLILSVTPFTSLLITSWIFCIFNVCFLLSSSCIHDVSLGFCPFLSPVIACFLLLVIINSCHVIYTSVLKYSIFSLNYQLLYCLLYFDCSNLSNVYPPVLSFTFKHLSSVYYSAIFLISCSITFSILSSSAFVSDNRPVAYIRLRLSYIFSPFA